MFFQRYLDMHVHSFFTSHYISKSRKLLASHEIFRHWVTECVWPQVAPKSLIDLKKCKSRTQSIGMGVFGVTSFDGGSVHELCHWSLCDPHSGSVVLRLALPGVQV